MILVQRILIFMLHLNFLFRHLSMNLMSQTSDSLKCKSLVLSLLTVFVEKLTKPKDVNCLSLQTILIPLQSKIIQSQLEFSIKWQVSFFPLFLAVLKLIFIFRNEICKSVKTFFISGLELDK